MDKNQLRQRLEVLQKQGQQFSYEQFPKMEYNLIGIVLPEWNVWVKRVCNAIELSFKDDSAPYMLVQKGAEDGNSLYGNDDDHFLSAKNNLLKAIEEALEALEGDFYGEIIGQSSSPVNQFDPKRVFIVHGHNHEAKNELELFVKELGLDPIVLHREADEGQTVIEKFEKHSKAGFAIILLTPDDAFASTQRNTSDERVERRARQNVIFEFGFFVGRLGRNRVCCLHQEGVTLPSDLAGLIYKPFKQHIEEVKFSLMKELKAAGYTLAV